MKSKKTVKLITTILSIIPLAIQDMSTITMTVNNNTVDVDVQVMPVDIDIQSIVLL